MKHFPTPRTFDLPSPLLRPMTDADWEAYILRRAQEEADHINATAPLQEKPRV